MTVQREQNMKREDQQDATIRFLLLTYCLLFVYFLFIINIS